MPESSSEPDGESTSEEPLSKGPLKQQESEEVPQKTEAETIDVQKERGEGLDDFVAERPTEEADSSEIKNEETEVAPEKSEPKRSMASARRSMRDLQIGKVVVNISVGESGEPLRKAMTILENLTDQKPAVRRAKQTIRSFGIRRNEPIACMVTLRGNKADEFLRMTFPAIGRRINSRSFDNNGNFAFGIREHIDIPGQRYNPDLGIVGMDVMATVERAGYRVARRRRARNRVGRSHRVSREESIEFIKQRFGVEVGLPSE